MSIEKLAVPIDELIAMKLFEIGDRLADQVAEGLVDTGEHTIGTEWYGLIGAWIACTIYNDGPADVYVRLGETMYLGAPWDNNEAPLKKGESLPINLGARKKETPTIYLICQSGTAKIRWFKVV